MLSNNISFRIELTSCLNEHIINHNIIIIIAVGFISRNDHKKDKELQEARKAGIAPAEVDEHGNEINPHIPQFISNAPWYLHTGKPDLSHQRKRKPDSNDSKPAKTRKADKSRKVACDNCGAKTHETKSCVERTRKHGAKWTGKNIAPDEVIKTNESDYEGKRDRWNGYDVGLYSYMVEQRYEARDEARVKYLKDEKLKKLDEAKIDESEEINFGKVEKRVRTTGGGSTGTVRNLRIREDPAKYLLNLDVNSAHYDPKTRSMREDPLPDADPSEKFYSGDNENRVTGEALEFKRNMHVLEAFNEVHMQGAPSQAELLCKDYIINQQKVKCKVKGVILEKYGNAGAEDVLPRELLLGQSEVEVEYDRAGRVIKGQGVAVVKGKYEEDVYVNNHTSVWGSWWKDHRWGYGCCKQLFRNSFCTGAAGIAAGNADHMY